MGLDPINWLILTFVDRALACPHMPSHVFTCPHMPRMPSHASPRMPSHALVCPRMPSYALACPRMP
eukprot:828570-Amorphochlora_amoeboformis.AAC.1